MNRRQRIAATRHVKNRKARRARIRAAIAYLVERAQAELTAEVRRGLLYGEGPFAPPVIDTPISLAEFIYRPQPTIAVKGPTP